MVDINLSAAERDRLIALAKKDALGLREGGKVTVQTVKALKERDTARVTLRNAGIDWNSAAARVQPAAPARAAAPKAASNPPKATAAPQRPQTAAADHAAGAAAFKQVLATNARLYGAPSPTTAAQPGQTSTRASWDAARAEMLETTGRA